MLRFRAAMVAASAILVVSACEDSPVAPVDAPLGVPAPLAVVAVPENPVVYDFNELTPNCYSNVKLADPYVDPDNPDYPLEFVTEAFLAPCTTLLLGEVELMPSAGYSPGLMYEVQINLPFETGVVVLDIYGRHESGREVVLTGYDGSGNIVATQSGWSYLEWTTLTLEGSPIVTLGITAPTADVVLDNLTLLPYVPQLDPTTVDACKDGGWETFGFRNQGQCIRFVNTGQDSRV